MEIIIVDEASSVVTSDLASGGGGTVTSSDLSVTSERPLDVLSRAASMVESAMNSGYTC